MAATSAAATPAVTATRLAGDDRFGTAQAIATATFNRSTVAVLASGENFPDALAASYLAGSLRAPVLLTPRGNVATETVSALQSLNVAGVTIVGGTDAVSGVVEADLVGRGYVVDRIAGDERYDTARRIAESQPAAGVGSLGTAGRTAIVASGETFPDALAGGPLSYDGAFPMLLTPPAALSEQASAALDRLTIGHVVLLGGGEAVSVAVENAIKAKGITVRRVAGATRTETAAAVADLAVGELFFAATHANLARGDAFPDALAGGPHAGRERSVILLTESPTSLGAATQSWLQQRSSNLNALHVFGGPFAVTDETVTAARRAAGATS